VVLEDAARLTQGLSQVLLHALQLERAEILRRTANSIASNQLPIRLDASILHRSPTNVAFSPTAEFARAPSATPATAPDVVVRITQSDARPIAPAASTVVTPAPAVEIMRTFSPRERRVPSSQVGRMFGFGSVFAK